MQIDVLGFRYDEAEPAFMPTEGGTYYYHQFTKRLFERSTFDVKLAREGKAFAAGELGTFSAAYVAEHEDMLDIPLSTTVPTAPTTPAVVAVSDSELDVSWVDASGGEAGFRIERSKGIENDFTEVGRVAAEVEIFHDSGLDAAQLYEYDIFAFNVAGDSTPAANASGTTDA